MKSTSDFLKDCMSGFDKTPLDDFQYSYCRVCANRECVRSALSGSMFDKRVNKWHEKLFLNVPRASDNDPNFSSIRSKKFIPIDPNPMEIRSSISVPQPQSQPMITIQRSDEPKPEIIVQTLEQPIEEKPIIITTPVASSLPLPSPSVIPNTQIPVNTEYGQGMVLPSSPEPSTPDVVLEPGQTYTFGGE